MTPDSLAPLARAGQVTARPQYPNLPSAYEPAALYLALALTARQKSSELIAPELVLKRLAELGWLRAVAVRPGCAQGLGWLDFSGARFQVTGIACFDAPGGGSSRQSDVRSFADRVFACQLPAPEAAR